MRILLTIPKLAIALAISTTLGIPVLAKPERPHKINLQARRAVIDKAGKLTRLPSEVKVCGDFNEGLLPVWLGGKHDTFLDKSLKFPFQPLTKFDSVGDFSDGMCCVTIKGKRGFIDRSGKLVIPAIYTSWVTAFHDGLACAKIGDEDDEPGEVAFINKTGAIVFTQNMPYASHARFSEGLCTTGQGNSKQVMNKKGVIAFPQKFHWVGKFSEGMAAAVPPEGKNVGFIDRSGKFAIPAKYDYTILFDQHFCSGLAPISRNYRWGFVDKSGHEVIPPKYDWARNFHEGRAAVRVKHRWGFVDRTGKLIIPAKYDSVSDFSDGVCRVYEGGIHHNEGYLISTNGGEFFYWSKPVFIDKVGKVLLRPKLRWHETIGDFKDGFATIRPAKYVDLGNGTAIEMHNR